jgi:hypothetical protein
MIKITSKSYTNNNLTKYLNPIQLDEELITPKLCVAQLEHFAYSPNVALSKVRCPFYT